MNKRIQRITPWSPGRSCRGSLLVLTLILVGVLAISVAAMLSSVRHLVRNADDKIAEEECYQAAMAGLNTTKAWLMRPDLATTQTGTVVAGALANISQGAVDLSNYVVNNKKTPEVIDNLPLEEVAVYFNVPGFTQKNVSGEDPPRRKVLFEWGGGESKPLVIRRGEANFGTPSTTLFNTTLGSDARSWVERIRITTPYRGNGSPPKDNLRLTSLIIEVEAKTRGAGIEKNRVLSGRVLVIPQRDLLPPAQSGAAILSGATIDIGGNSPLKIHWGPVWSKKDLTLLGVTFHRGDTAKPNTGNPPRLVFDTASGNARYTGVGTTDPFGNPEKWLRYLAGTSGKLVNKQGQQIFGDGAGIGSGVPVTDFFVQLKAGQFPGWSADTYTQIDTKGTLSEADDTIGVKLEGLNPLFANGTGAEGAYYDRLNTQAGERWTSASALGKGALGQGIPGINERIDGSFNSLDYRTWKNFAITNKGYARPSGNGFVNATGQTLYVTSQKTLTTVNTGTPFTDLKQISMKNLVPSNGNTAGIPDRMLFIDTLNGTETGAKSNVKITSQDDFFWKGMMFINGDLSVGGSGAMPDIWGKNPDQYAASPPDRNNRGQGHLITECFLDGILRATGTVSATGNPKVLGSIVAGTPTTEASFGSGGSPEVFYNPRVRDGLFRDPQDPLWKGIVSGPVVELSQYRPSL